MLSDTELLIDYALRFVGTPYIYGGKSFAGFDCSGFLSEILKPFSILPNQTLSSIAIHEYLITKFDRVEEIFRGDILFFGNPIEHCGIAVSPNIYLSSRGGDNSTTTVDKAIKKNAFVALRPIRKDLTSIIRINF